MRRNVGNGRIGGAPPGMESAIAGRRRGVGRVWAAPGRVHRTRAERRVTGRSGGNLLELPARAVNLTTQIRRHVVEFFGFQPGVEA